MPTFIDESRDTGPINAGGTPYFRLAAVWVPSLNDDDQFRTKTQQLRLDLGLPKGYDEAEASRQSPLKELIVVDDNADQEFLEIIKRQFRGLRSKRNPGSSMIGKVVFRNSFPFEMLQFVDMVCGATGFMIEGNDRTSYDLIVARSLNPL
jgi:Protein of unknown function (DUF3800)